MLCHVAFNIETVLSELAQNKEKANWAYYYSLAFLIDTKISSRASAKTITTVDATSVTTITTLTAKTTTFQGNQGRGAQLNIHNLEAIIPWAHSKVDEIYPINAKPWKVSLYFVLLLNNEISLFQLYCRRKRLRLIAEALLIIINTLSLIFQLMHINLQSSEAGPMGFKLSNDRILVVINTKAPHCWALCLWMLM